MDYQRAWMYRWMNTGCKARVKVFRLINSITAIGLAAGIAFSTALAENVEILNVSYDVSREFYKDFNAAFSRFWEMKTGQTVTIQQSHGASSTQVLAVINGLEADVVTMNQPIDIDLLAANGLVSTDWRKRFPYASTPFTSTIVFLVRKGNPKGIKDWGDLIKPGLKVIVPNPKTSGNGRYSYLAAWGYGLREGGDEQHAKRFVTQLFENVPVLDTGSRASSITFIERGIGDVLLTMENEVLFIGREFNSDDFEVVMPSLSILAEAPVAVIDKVVDKRATRTVAEAYLNYLFSDNAQRLAARYYFRPRAAKINAEFKERFAPIKLFTVDEVFGGWQQAQRIHFAAGGTFDQLYQH